MSEPTIDEIMAMIAQHGSVTAEPLRDLIVTVVLEAVEAEREACAKVCISRAILYRNETDPWAHDHVYEAKKCAAIIRARGE